MSNIEYRKSAIGTSEQVDAAYNNGEVRPRSLEDFMAQRAIAIPLLERQVNVYPLHALPGERFAPGVNVRAPVPMLRPKGDARLINDTLLNGWKRWDDSTRRTYTHGPSRSTDRPFNLPVAMHHTPERQAFFAQIGSDEMDERFGGSTIASVGASSTTVTKINRGDRHTLACRV